MYTKYAIAQMITNNTTNITIRDQSIAYVAGAAFVKIWFAALLATLVDISLYTHISK
jgi:hypothetical protein